MKTRIALLFSLLFTLVCTPGYSQKKDSATIPNLVYRIQIGTVSIKPKAQFLLKRYHITDEPFLEVENASTVKVMVGSYANYSSANERLTELKKKGIKGAFIAPYYKGKRVSLQEAATHSQE